jgi:hypothetical protein
LRFSTSACAEHDSFASLAILDIHQDIGGSFFHHPRKRFWHGDGFPQWLLFGQPPAAERAAQGPCSPLPYPGKSWR